MGGRALYIIQDIIIKPFENTLLSALSRLSDRNAQSNATLRVFRMSSFIAFPIFFGAAAIATEFITLAFGIKWETSGKLMTILSLGIAPQIIGNHVNSALTASGNSKKVMWLSSIDFFLIFALGFFIIPYGITAATYAFSISSYCTVLFSLLIFNKVFSVTLRDIFRSIYVPFIASLLMFLGTLWINHWLLHELPILLRLLVLAFSGCLIYSLLMVLLFRSTTRHFLNEVHSLAPENFRGSLAKIQRLLGLL